MKQQKLFRGKVNRTLRLTREQDDLVQSIANENNIPVQRLLIGMINDSMATHMGVKSFWRLGEEE